MAEYDLGTARGRIVLDTTGARTGAKQAQRSMSGLRGQAQRTGQQFKAAGRTMSKTGASLSKKVTAPIVGLGVATVATAADFESSMNKVKAVSGATEDQMGRMESQARELGSTTQFSASEAAEGMSFLSMAGFEAEETISAMPGVLDLAAAGQMDLARTADIASNVLTGFGMEAEETGRVTDVMAETASSANTDMNQLGDAMSYVAPVANSSGMAIEETSAAIGALSDAGIQGSRAGTSLRQIIARLESPSKKAANKIEELGIKTHDASGNLLPMADIVEQLGESGATTADIMDMFGARAGPSMAAMIDQGADSLREQEEALKNSQGRAKEMAETQMEGLSGALKELKSALQEVALTIADTGLLDQMTNLAEKMTSWFRKLGEVNPRLMKIGVIVAGVVAAIGPLLVVLGLVVSAIGSLLPVLAAVAGALSLPVVAIGALIAGLVLLYTKSETVRDIVNAAFKSIVDFAMQVWPQIRDIITTVIDIIEGAIRLFVATVEAIWRTWGATIVRFVREAFNGIKQVIQGVLDVIGGILETFAGLFSGDWSRMWEGMKQVASGISQIINGIVDAFFGALRGLLSSAKTVLTSIWSDLWGAIKRTASSAIDAVVSWVKGLPGRAKSALSSAWNAYKAFWITIFTAIKDFVSDRVDDVIGFFSDLPGNLKSVLSSAWNSYKNWWQDKFQAVRDFVSDRVDDVIRFFKDLPSNLISALLVAWNTFDDWVDRNFTNAVHDKVGEIVDAVIKFFSDLPGNLVDVLKAAWSAWSDFWTRVFTEIKDFVLDRVKDIISDVKSLPERAKNALESTWNTFKSHWDSVFNSAKDFVSNTLSTLVDYVKNFPGRIKNGLENAWGKFRRLWDTSFNGVKNFASTTVENIVNFIRDLPSRLRGAFEGAWNTFKDKAKDLIEGFKSDVADAVNDIVRWFGNLPGRIWDQIKSIGDKVKDAFSFSIPGISMGGQGDGPGAPVPRSAGGSALDRVQSALNQVPGGYITSTYRTPAENAAAGGSPTSYHLDPNNPAVDIGAASAGTLDMVAGLLRQMGPWREFLWRVPNHAPGDNMHIHVAHGGGVMGGIGSREMMALLERGEGVISADAMQNIEAAMGRRSVPSLTPDAMFESMEFNQHNYGLTSEDDVKRATKRGLRQMAAEWEFS